MATRFFVLRVLLLGFESILTECLEGLESTEQREQDLNNLEAMKRVQNDAGPAFVVRGVYTVRFDGGL